MTSIAKARDLRIVHQRDSEAFGDALVHLVGKELEVQVTRDKSILWIDVRAPGTDKWWPLKLLMGFLTGDPAWESVATRAQGDDTSNLDQRWCEIVHAVADQRGQLAAFAEQRAARIVQQLKNRSR